MKATTTGLLLLLATTAGAQCDSLSFSLDAKPPTCRGTDGSIRVVNLQGTAPFRITGTGTTFGPGTYTVQVKDACNTIRTRTVTLAPYIFDFTWTFTGQGCNRYTFSLNATVPATYGYRINGGPLTWATGNAFTLTATGGAGVTLYAKDSCGNTVEHAQFINKEYGGYIKALQYRLQCDKVDIFPLFFGFNAPTVCLYDFATKALLQCKQAPAGTYTGGAATNFFDVPYGKAYYVIVQDGCYRDSAWFPDMTSSGGSELNPYNWDCTTFTMHVDGMEDTVCLYNAVTNQLVSCKGQDTVSINPRTGVPWPSGAVWENLPYGSYYAWIYDPCERKTFKIDSTVRYPFSFGTQLAGHCSVNQTAVVSSFDPGAKGPYTTTVFYPDGTTATVFQSYNTTGYVLYNTWPQPGRLTVVQRDGCGYADTSYLDQPMLFPERQWELKGGCIGPLGSTGSADVILHGNEPYRTGTAAVVKYNGRDTVIGRSHASGSDLYFINLEAGTYVIKSVVGCYGFTLYDTVVVPPYRYPRQYLSVVSCAGGVLTFRDSVGGGVGPYTFEMVAPLQTTFPGTFALAVDSVTAVVLKATDACGNSHTLGINVAPGGCRILPLGDRPSVDRWSERDPVVYPNPTIGAFVVSFARKKKEDYTLTLYNAGGAVVWRRTVRGVDRSTVPVTGFLPHGLYALRIESLVRRENWTRQIIVR